MHKYSTNEEGLYFPLSKTLVFVLDTVNSDFQDRVLLFLLNQPAKLSIPSTPYPIMPHYPTPNLPALKSIIKKEKMLPGAPVNVERSQ